MQKYGEIMEKVTPMMKQYLEVKSSYKDSILFFRLGDFYEMFFDDAITASKELEITLTGKSCGLEERAPMCGVPYHAAENYISRLVSKGYSVAICEQTEDPSEAKGIVKREVIRVITPGTVVNIDALEKSKNNYLMCIYEEKENYYGISVVDTTTGEFRVTELDGKELMDVQSEVAKYTPSEIICNEAFYKHESIIKSIADRHKTYFNLQGDYIFNLSSAENRLKQHFKVSTLDGFGLKGRDLLVAASGGILEYLYEKQKTNLEHFRKLNVYNVQDFMVLDSSTRRNLELTETIREKSKRGSLLWVLDKTKTAMGARLLKKWIEQPLLDKNEIEKRLNAVSSLKSSPMIREELKELLAAVYDFERLLSKIVYQTVNARDLIALKSSIEVIQPIKVILNDLDSTLIEEIRENMDSLSDIYRLIDNAIVTEPPFSIREGGIIKEGYNEEADRLKSAKRDGKKWLLEIEEKEKEKTGIKNLKVSYNKIFGYYIEVTKANIPNVPGHFIRKQTLANCERYITEDLKRIEDDILGAEEKLYKLEYELFTYVREEILKATERIQKSAQLVAQIDVLTSLGEVAEKQNYIKPEITEDTVIEIKDGRHPVVEKIVEKDQFIANDTYLDNDKNEIAIITGPNMAGKSTYMRQVAIITLMAQIGSFVPACYAKISLVDRIFTRVGASDDLSSGQSTFMIEMIEVANILNNATNKSLLILDEIGRGTSTFDGLSIAWSVIEYIDKFISAKTLFATHYHELTELEQRLEKVKNYYISVKEAGDNIIFLRKIMPGGSESSFGVQVAKLAGLPDDVIKRSKEILTELDKSDIIKYTNKVKRFEKSGGISDEPVNDYSAVIESLDNIDLNSLTPIEAINVLYDLKEKRKES